jgi:hypothetical protein
LVEIGLQLVKFGYGAAGGNFGDNLCSLDQGDACPPRSGHNFRGSLDNRLQCVGAAFLGLHLNGEIAENLG